MSQLLLTFFLFLWCASSLITWKWFVRLHFVVATYVFEKWCWGLYWSSKTGSSLVIVGLGEQCAYLPWLFTVKLWILLCADVSEETALNEVLLLWRMAKKLDSDWMLNKEGWRLVLNLENRLDDVVWAGWWFDFILQCWPTRSGAGCISANKHMCLLQQQPCCRFTSFIYFLESLDIRMADGWRVIRHLKGFVVVNF